MKKIYLLILVILTISFTPFQNVLSQNVCPRGIPLINHIRINNTLCVVFVDRMWPSSTVLLFDINLQVIATASADVTGFAALVYACDKTAFRVTSCVNNPPTVGCCSALVPAAASLPVKLSAFNVRINSDNSIGLVWRSEFELNSFRYVVERSNDGYNFAEVGSVPAAGNSSKFLNYTFTDNTLTSGAGFYRLRQVDIDGKYEYSKVVYINNKNAVGIITKIFPNPFTTDIQLIGITSSELNRLNVQVYNAMGQQVPYKVTGGNAIALVDNAASGVYILRVKNQQFKLVKQ